MNARSFGRAVRALLTIVGMAACASDPTAPAKTPDSSAGLLGDLLSVHELQWSTPLAQDISTSAVIGRNGGTIRLDQTGLVVNVPAGAVSSDTRFTVTAVAGNAVAYEFEPHGTVFGRPLQARQDLRLTNWNGLLWPSLKAGYFTDRSLINLGNGDALVSALFDGLTNLLRRDFTWPIPHFSGYIVCW